MDAAVLCLHNVMIINIINAIRVRTWHANVPTGGCYPSASEIPKICHICGISVNKNYHRRETNPNDDSVLNTNVICERDYQSVMQTRHTNVPTGGCYLWAVRYHWRVASICTKSKNLPYLRNQRERQNDSGWMISIYLVLTTRMGCYLLR